jgi:hypothetical protein
VPSDGRGRPRALNDERKRLVVALVQKGISLTQAAAFAACNRDTIIEERKRDPQFDANLVRAKEMRDVEPLCIIASASKTSWRAAAWLVARRDKLKENARSRRDVPKPRPTTAKGKATKASTPKTTPAASVAETASANGDAHAEATSSAAQRTPDIIPARPPVFAGNGAPPIAASHSRPTSCDAAPS